MEKVTKTNQSVDKVLDVIEIMSKAGRPLQLNEIAAMCGMPQSTVYRLVNALLKRGYVIQDKGTSQYLLSLQLSYIGDMVRANMDIRYVAHPYMEKLSIELQNVAYLALPQGGELVYIDMVCPPMSVLDRLPFVGKHVPLCFGGIGRNILSDYSESELNDYFASLPENLLASANVTEEAIREDLKSIRKKGYCVSALNIFGNGNGSISSGIRDYTGRIIAGISMGGPKERLTEQYLKETAPIITDAAREISKQLAFKTI